MRIDLVYFDGCPHVTAARLRLREALASLGRAAVWSEWESNASTTPETLRGYASPTVLVDGVDVAGRSPVSGAGCAVDGGPDLAPLRRALQAAAT